MDRGASTGSARPQGQRHGVPRGSARAQGLLLLVLGLLPLGAGCSIDITPRMHPGGQLVEVESDLEAVQTCRRMGTMRNVTGQPGAGVRARNLAWEAGGDTILLQETRNDLYDCARFGIPVLKLAPRTDLPTLDLAHPEALTEDGAPPTPAP